VFHFNVSPVPKALHLSYHYNLFEIGNSHPFASLRGGTTWQSLRCVVQKVFSLYQV
jgi:hypothetical protein